MGTDRLKLSSQARVQNNPPAHVSRMFSNTRYVSILAAVVEGARRSRADALVSLHSLRTINPPTSRMSRKSRIAGTINAGTPSLERVGCHGGVLPPASYITLFRHFCHFLRHPLRFKRYNPRIIQNAISKP